MFFVKNTFNINERTSSESSIVRIIIFSSCLLLISSCLSNNSPYLDDNLSDRMAVAERHFDKTPIYFDTSKFEYIATRELSDNQERELHEVNGSSPEALSKLLLSAKKESENVAVSGIDEKHSAAVIIMALTILKNEDLSNVNLLYIGSKEEFESLVLVIGQRLKLSFEPMPATTPWEA